MADSYQKKDHWSSTAYSSAANFVPKLTTTVFSYLDPQPGDNILDIGCGDGVLTAQIAQAAAASSPTGSTRGGTVLGLDASQSFIQTANEKYRPRNCRYALQDCRRISECSEAVTGQWDKVFSNAALHWILCDASTRVDVFTDVHRALKQGGRFVFEMGGKGNVSEVHTAFLAVLAKHGVPLEEARKADPWFFPSVEWMQQSLERVGFKVEKCELEYRPTKLTQAKDWGGIEGWARLMGAQFLEVVPSEQRDAVVKNVCEVLETIISREEDGSKWIGYVRLRAVARKQ
ncbi:hypothetical protein K431DRAFT_27665 [Polychaeton citri CBS 116435]|uniref:Methyltransferase domain-containing protein n=1 Tax=Polychaeton citri CBS 116435 TaxID=1314669 RepID=A0A9P4QBS3_9PEZI|nr:hypothetical protein K431DRAFT_27665 [Polychaeton citri CBS 116435]